MNYELILILAAASFIASFIKGLTGLGFSTTCLAIMALFIDIKVAIPLVIIPSVASNIVTMRTAGHIQETVGRFWPLFLATLPGLVLGLWLLTWAGSKVGGAVLGSVLIAYALFALAKPSFFLSKKLYTPLSLPVGFTTGVLNGLTGSQVMPVLPFLMSLNLDNDRFVQAINCSFTLSSLVMASGLIYLGYMTFSHMIMSLTALVFVFCGVYAGTAIRKKLSVAIFRKVILLFLMLLGLGLVL